MTKSIRPIKSLTVMVDACVLRRNPAAGDQLASLLGVLKKNGVECHVLQERFCLLEATGHAHELALSENMIRQQMVESGTTRRSDRARKRADEIPANIDTYLKFADAVQEVVPITYFNAPTLEEILHERRELTRRYLFEDERLKEWPAVRRDMLDKKLMVSDLDDYNHSLFQTANSCSHNIEAIHERLKREPALRTALTQQDKKDFMLDIHRQGRAPHWHNIEFGAMDPQHMPFMVMDGFGHSRVMLKLLGKCEQDGTTSKTRENLTPLGRLMLHKQMDLGEKVIEQEARKHLKGHGPNSGEAMLLITDDAEGLRRFENVEKDYPNCTAISSRELATMVVTLNGQLNMPKHFPPKTMAEARGISDGSIRTNSSSARESVHIRSCDSSFTDRALASATMPASLRERMWK